MMLMPVLQTERLRIRPFTLDDLEAIHQLLDVDLRHVDFGDTGAKTRQARHQWLQRLLQPRLSASGPDTAYGLERGGAKVGGGIASGGLTMTQAATPQHDNTALSSAESDLCRRGR